MDTKLSPSALGSPLDGLLTLEEHQRNRERLFPSVEAMRWFIRQRRRDLEETGALLYIRGRLWIDPSKFDDCVLANGRRQTS